VVDLTTKKIRAGVRIDILHHHLDQIGHRTERTIVETHQKSKTSRLNEKFHLKGIRHQFHHGREINVIDKTISTQVKQLMLGDPNERLHIRLSQLLGRIKKKNN